MSAVYLDFCESDGHGLAARAWLGGAGGGGAAQAPAAREGRRRRGVHRVRALHTRAHLPFLTLKANKLFIITDIFANMQSICFPTRYDKTMANGV